MKAIIIDDEKNCIEVLKWQLEKYCPEISVAGNFDNAIDAIESINSEKPELIFLDIEMPVINGFDMLKHFNPITFEVIFTTAYDHFALKAFKVNAVDYLLKPIESKDLIQAVQKVKNKIEAQKPNEQLEKFLMQMGNNSNLDAKIGLPTSNGLIFIKQSSIIYCNSDGGYTHIFTTDSPNPIMISKNLKEVELSLNQEVFVRVHHSFLINLNHIAEYIRGEGGQIIMSNKHSITVSRAKKQELIERFNRI